MKVLVTCPPMLGMIDAFRGEFASHGIELTCPHVSQTLSVAELSSLVPQHHGWIIGDDPANREVIQAGVAGKLKAAVKWGVGVDNVDFDACREFGLPIVNTPGMFGNEVADVALGYVIALARGTFEIDRAVRAGGWPKPRGISLSGKTVALVGLGDIGRQLLPRLVACQLRVIVYDPASSVAESESVANATWPARLGEADFVVVTCALTKSSRHLVNGAALAACRRGVRVVNVSRGAVIDEPALIDALVSGQVQSAALDVFENEPLPADSRLRSHQACIFGSHNASNTEDAVVRTSRLACSSLLKMLGVTHGT